MESKSRSLSCVEGRRVPGQQLLQTLVIRKGQVMVDGIYDAFCRFVKGLCSFI